MGRSGYDDNYGDDDPLALGRWRGAVLSSIRGRRGQAFLKEMLAALDALPRKRLVANVLEQYTVEEDGPVPIEDGDVCAFGAVGRARGVAMPVIYEDADYEAAEEIQGVFGTADALTREIMFVNDECGSGRRVPLPNVLEYPWDCFAYIWLPETPEERFARVRRWVVSQIKDVSLRAQEKD